MNIPPMSLCFNFARLCAWNLATLKRLIGYKFERKSCEKPAPLRTLVGLIFERNKNRSKYTINQGVDVLKTFQAIINAPIILGCKLLLVCIWSLANLKRLVCYKSNKSSRKRSCIETVIIFYVWFLCASWITMSMMNHNEYSVIAKNAIFDTIMNIWSTVDCIKQVYRHTASRCLICDKR